jgi:hypothetical protein
MQGDMANGSPNQTQRLTELSDIIAAKTKAIDDYFKANNLPALTFDPSGPPDFPVPSTNEEIQRARRAVVNATQELHDLMVGPRESVRWMAWSVSLLSAFSSRPPSDPFEPAAAMPRGRLQ